MTSLACQHSNIPIQIIISLERYHLVVSIICWDIWTKSKHSMTIWVAAKWKSTKNFGVTFHTLLSNATSFYKYSDNKRSDKRSIFSSLIQNLERIKGFTEQILRHGRHHAKNRISTLYRMIASYMCTLDLSSLLKNCNTSRVKMKSAIFLQMSYRFEWYPIFIHYLNL